MRRLLLLTIILSSAMLTLPTLRSAAQTAEAYVPARQSLALPAGPARLSTGPQTYDAVAAPRPFSHLLAHTVAEIPSGAALTIELRVSSDGATWSDWRAVEPNDDLNDPATPAGSFWSQILEVGGTATHWQARATPHAAPDGAAPTLRQLDVHTVDTLAGPSDPQPDLAGAPGRAALPGTMAVGKPAVVSRTAWGSPDGQSSRATPAYRTVTTLVVHHTADGNTLRPGEPNWAARVRAIWSYHAITLGWGDIGYNFLIDPDGVIYEGRAGGDNAVGFHDTANYGSMGVSMLGTYTSASPTAATQDSLVRLLAWKASQQGIDPTGSGFYYGCSISRYCAPFNAGSVVPNIAGHRQVTPGHTTCPGDATMALMPGLRDRVRQLVGGGAADPQVSITSVRFPRTTVAAGELLEAQITVRNSGQVTLASQAPQVDLSATDAFNTHAYRYDECFNGTPSGQGPIFPKETGRVRITLGTPNWDAANSGRCSGATSNYPWRWGLNGDLPPGQERTIIALIQMTTPGTYTIQAGVINEFVGYLAQGVGATTITVTAERSAPEAASYDELLRPSAQVYRLGDMPDSFLGRLATPATLARGAYVGSFAWGGEPLSWGGGGPFGLSDNFLIIQTRLFRAPTAGSYGFRITTDDGGWLLVDGQLVAAAPGLHPAQTATGSVQLGAGMHTLTVVSFEATGQAYAAYDYQPPGAAGYQPLPDALGDQPRSGARFSGPTQITIAADDLGGSGVSSIRWDLNGSGWLSSPGSIAPLGRLQSGSYTLSYQPIDAAGNAGPIRIVRFGVDAEAPQTIVSQIYLPSVAR